jgi:antitoxin HicB
MKTKKIAFDHSGSSFDDFLEEEGIREEVEAVAIKRVLAWQFSREMERQKKTKQAMARDLQTSRSQLDRLLDPRNVSVSLETMARAARALGKSLMIRIGDRKVGGGKRRGGASGPKEQRVKRTYRHGAEIRL